MEPLRGGRLALNLPASAQAVFNRSGRRGTPAEWALSWIWNHREVSLLISGMNSIEQVAENIASASRATAGSFTEKDGQVIERVRDGFYQKPRVDCTACGYCLPCPSGVDIPGCFEASNHFHQTGMKADYWLLKPEQRASCCMDCGLCEENCPQSLPIPELLKEVKGILEKT